MQWILFIMPSAIQVSKQNVENWLNKVSMFVINAHLFVGNVISNIRRGIAEWERTLPCMGRWRDVTSLSRPRDYMYFFRGSG